MLDFSNRTDLQWLADVLHDAQVAAPTTDLLIIGAMARDLLYGYAHGIQIARQTTDVDFAVAVGSWHAFHALRNGLLTSTLLGQSPLKPEEFRQQLVAYQRGLLANR